MQVFVTISKGKCKECKELIDKCLCDKGFIWNLHNCEFECDKLCDAGEYYIMKILTVEKG